MRAQELVNRILWILEICELARTGRTDLAAGGRQSLGDSVITQRAFLRRVGLGVDEAAAVRTCLHTVTAAEAVVLVDKNHAVGRDESCANGTNLCTGRVLAVVAQFRYEEVLAVADLIRRESLLAAIRRFDFGPLDLPIGDVVPLDPGTEVAIRDIVLFGARPHTTSGTDALGNVDQHAPPVLGEFVVGSGRGCASLNILPGDGSCRQQDEEAAASDFH